MVAVYRGLEAIVFTHSNFIVWLGATQLVRYKFNKNHLGINYITMPVSREKDKKEIQAKTFEEISPKVGLQLGLRKQARFENMKSRIYFTKGE